MGFEASGFGSAPVAQADLPTWLFQGTSGSCAPGKFVTDAATALNTTQIQISGTNEAGSDSSYIAGVSVGSIIVFRQGGMSASYTITGMQVINDSDGDVENGCLLMALTNPKGALNWGGHYSITYLPAV